MRLNKYGISVHFFGKGLSLNETTNYKNSYNLLAATNAYGSIYWHGVQIIGFSRGISFDSEFISVSFYEPYEKNSINLFSCQTISFKDKIIHQIILEAVDEIPTHNRKKALSYMSLLERQLKQCA